MAADSPVAGALDKKWIQTTSSKGKKKNFRKQKYKKNYLLRKSLKII